jgi:hypothetical protein
MKQTIETWFNHRFKDILPLDGVPSSTYDVLSTDEEEEEKNDEEKITKTVQPMSTQETNKLFSPLFDSKEKSIYSQSEPSFVGTDTIPTFVNEIPFPSYDKPPSLGDFPFPVHQVNGGQPDMFKRRQDSNAHANSNIATQFRTYI